MHKLMVIGIEGNELVAVSPTSGIELGRSRVFQEDIQAHIEAAEGLMVRVFNALNAEGFHRATVDPMTQ